MTQKCNHYGGIASSSKAICCASGCGACGGSGCGGLPGGKEECCTGSIPEENICGVSGISAPCHLGTTTHK